MNSLIIHFLNVGHGDCTIVELAARLTMIDINNSRTLDKDSEREIAKLYGVTDSDWELSKLWATRPQKIRDYEKRLTDPASFFVGKYGKDQSIFRFILTHPDMDHMTGVYNLHVDRGIDIVNFWDTKHSIQKSEKPEDWENTGYDIRDWQEYKRLRKSTGSPKALFPLRGDENQFWTDDGITIWSPFEHAPDISEDDRVNQLTYIILIQYGKCNILLGGDAEIPTWERIYEAFNGRYPKVHLLKAPHHGRKSGYHWQSVKAMAPDYTVVSVGELKKKDDAFASYEKWSEKGCYSTRFEGDITARCWEDGDVWLYDHSGTRL